MLRKLSEIADKPDVRDPFLEKREKRAIAREQLKRWKSYPWRIRRFKFAGDVEEDTAKEMCKKARRKYRKVYTVEREETGLYCYSFPMKSRYPWDTLVVGDFFVMSCNKSGAYRLLKKNAKKLNRNFKLVEMGPELRCYRKDGIYQPNKYPWETMKVDESFELVDVASDASARSIVARANGIYRPFRRFWLEIVGDCDYLVWRTK